MTVKMACLRQFCFCFNLRTGGVILGWIEAFLRLLSVVLCCIMIDDPHLFVPTPEAYVDGTRVNPSDFDKRYAEDEKDREYIRKIIKYTSVAGLMFSMIYLISAGLLITGSIKGNRFMLLPWLIMNTIDIILSAATVVVVFLCVEPGFGVPPLIFLCLKLYLWICIMSLFQHIHEETKRQEQSVLQPLKNTVTGYPPQPLAYEQLNEAPLIQLS